MVMDVNNTFSLSGVMEMHSVGGDVTESGTRMQTQYNTLYCTWHNSVIHAILLHVRICARGRVWWDMQARQSINKLPGELS